MLPPSSVSSSARLLLGIPLEARRRVQRALIKATGPHPLEIRCSALCLPLSYAVFPSASYSPGEGSEESRSHWRHWIIVGILVFGTASPISPTSTRSPKYVVLSSTFAAPCASNQATSSQWPLKLAAANGVWPRLLRLRFVGALGQPSRHFEVALCARVEEGALPGHVEAVDVGAGTVIE